MLSRVRTLHPEGFAGNERVMCPQYLTKATWSAAYARLVDRPKPADPVPLACWLPLRPGLTPHGLRHGHQTWLDDLGIRYVLQSERMGHEVPGMRGIYSHVTAAMRSDLKNGLQAVWEKSLRQRAAISERSAVPVLDKLMALLPSGSQLPPGGDS